MTWHVHRSALNDLPALYNKRNCCIHVHRYLFVWVHAPFHWFNRYAYLKLGVSAWCQLFYLQTPVLLILPLINISSVSATLSKDPEQMAVGGVFVYFHEQWSCKCLWATFAFLSMDPKKGYQWSCKEYCSYDSFPFYPLLALTSNFVWFVTL